METDVRLFNMARAKTQPDPRRQAKGLSKTTHAGSQTHEWIVSSGVDQTRQWLRDAPVCRALQRYGIVHVGVAEANDPWTLDKIADLAGLSPRQFRRVNLHATGASPRDYLTSLRMQLAISLLIETDEKVETIAKRVGHRSLFTFSNRFRAFTGNSPSDYRKSSSR